MKKDVQAHDTEPIDPPAPTGADAASRGEARTATTDAGPDGDDLTASEHDADDFLRWLPTMSLSDRRRRQIVRRPSSDGANFAAYASAARSPAASVPPKREAGAKMQSLLRHEVHARTQGAGAHVVDGPDRDAATVPARRTIVARRKMLAGWGAAGLIATGIAVAARAHRPLTVERAAPHTAAIGTPSALVVDHAQRVAPPEATPRPSPEGSQPIEPARACPCPHHETP